MNWGMVMVIALAANAFEERFEQGNAAYMAGDYAGASQAYAQLLAEHVAAPAVFYNLGNACYRQGRLGEAIAHYEQALQLDPQLAAAAENLATALRGTARSLPRPPRRLWERIVLPWDEGLQYLLVLRLSVACWALFWGVLALRQWRRLRYTRRGAAVLLALSALFGLSAWAKAHPTPLAVAVVEAAPVHYGPSDEETVRFELREGDRVRVESQAKGWVRVSAADGARGWTHAASVMMISAPEEMNSGGQ